MLSPESLPTPQAVLRADQLTVGYANRRSTRPVVRDFSVSLRAGEFVCLIGPNGAGKSTLLRTLTGMQRPLSGAVFLQGEELERLPLPERARKLSVVLTERFEAGNLSVGALVSLGRHPYTDWSGRLTAHDEAVVRKAMAVTGVTAMANRPVSELSDGERQRVMIARALAQEPILIVLDEPTAYLDLPRRVEIMRILASLAHQSGKAVLLSTHDLDLALRTADRIWLLAEGHVRDGSPESLILSGAFEDAFRNEGLRFDRTTGAFDLQFMRRGRVQLRGQGIAAIWTAHALERAGYEVVQSATAGSSADFHVEVSENTEQTIWRIEHGAQTAEFQSLEAFIQAIKL